MSALTLWMRIVGALYLFLFVAATFLRLPVKAEGPKGMLEEAAAGNAIARYALDTWVILGLYYLVIGASLIVFSITRVEVRSLVHAVLGLEVAGIAVDVFKLTRGYPRTVMSVWIVIHSTIIATGVAAL